MHTTRHPGEVQHDLEMVHGDCVLAQTLETGAHDGDAGYDLLVAGGEHSLLERSVDARVLCGG